MSTIAGPSTSAAALGSDDDVQMVESNGDAITTTAAADAIDVDGDGDGDDGDDDDDEGEGEYEIEFIVSHFQDDADNQMSYFVKWKGYPNSENSWVYESDMGGAQEMIREYWAKMPEKRVKKVGTKASKKGKRQSSIAASSPASKAASSSLAAAGKRSSRRESSLLAGDAGGRTKGARRNGADALAASRSPTPDDGLIDVETDPALQRIRSDPSLTDQERATLEAQHLHTLTIDRLRKRYARIADWDPIVKRVEAVEKMSDSKLRVFLHFENGDRLAFESVVAHHRCPLKLLAFYESNLRFKEREEERREMRGEEQTTELDEYTARQVNGMETQDTVQADETQQTEPAEATQTTEQAEQTQETAEAPVADPASSTLAPTQPHDEIPITDTHTTSTLEQPTDPTEPLDA